MSSARTRLPTDLPDAVGEYFAPELSTVASYLDRVPAALDDGDPTVGPVHPVPWLYVADLTGWRGLALARLLAARRDCPCYGLSALAADAVETLWAAVDRSADGPVVVHLELRGDAGPIPAALREALRRGYERPAGPDADAVAGDPTNVVVVFTDTDPSKRLDSPLPDATTPVSGAALSYAPRDSMTPEQPAGTTTLPAPPALGDRTDELAAVLSAALDGTGSESDREQYVDSAVEALATTHAAVGRRDLLFDVSPRVALAHGHRLPAVGLDDALAGLRRDLLARVPESPGSEELRATLADLL
ncbi:hypothetical protein [Haloarcula litorea]|uniref:hypothetical protein n=1 Tax=Haloarcula litorea TaxID=3032579 RepID=UPI0023E88092|nr:hypothetical protein [Halomicroarcula sp. GDY20]